MSTAVRTDSPARERTQEPKRVGLVDLRDEPISTAHGLQAILAVVLGLLGLYLAPVFLTGARLPFGSDAAYYVWMSRLAGHAGLAASGFRAGSHALLYGVSSVSGVDLLRAIGPLDVALEIALGLAAAALVCTTIGFTRARFVVVGLVTSAYAARMATGYLANLLFLVLLLAAIAVLLRDRRRTSLGLSAALLVAAGLAHGAFFAFALLVLGGAVVLRWLWPGSAARSSRTRDAGRLVVLGAACATAIAVLVLTHRLSIGGSMVLHSGDAILRKLGQRHLLKWEYGQRFPGSVQAAGLYATAPLAAWGAWFTASRSGSRSRIATAVTASGVVATIGGVGAGLVTGWFPAGRVLGVAVWLPMLAAIGVLGIAATLARKPGMLRAALATVLTLVLLLAPFRSLLGSNVAASPAEIAASRAAAHFADTLPPHTPLVYLVDVGGSNPAFQASRFENVTRMGLPASRMADVYLFLGTPADLAAGRPALNGDPVHDGLARLYARRSAPARAEPHAVFLLQPFEPHEWTTVHAGRLVAPRTRVVQSPLRHGTGSGVPSLGQVSPWARLLYAIAFLVLLLVAGIGWMRALMPKTSVVVQVALAPAVGAGALVLGSVLADAVGLHLASSAVWVVPLAAVAGMLAWWRTAAARRLVKG